jgi:hypothetical protein
MGFFTVLTEHFCCNNYKEGGGFMPLIKKKTTHRALPYAVAVVVDYVAHNSSS